MKEPKLQFTTIKVAGTDALSTLESLRAKYPTSGEYPFILGDDEELQRMQEAAEFNEDDPAEIIAKSLEVDRDKWMAEIRAAAEEYDFSVEEMLSDWPGENPEKGSIGLHKDLLSGKVKPEVYLGLATIEHPWQLPAVLKYGGWNDCPYAEVHCAFHRSWESRFGAQISGMSGDIVECVVSNPPRDQASAVELAWEQYWYCADIVDQGCGSIHALAATLMNSNYWFFWWD